MAPPQISARKAQATINTTAPLPLEVALLFKRGFALHQRGQLAQAQLIYQELLAKEPRHFDALHLSGLIAAQNGNPMLAADLIEKALQINSNNAAAHFNRALALQSLNRLGKLCTTPAAA